MDLHQDYVGLDSLRDMFGILSGNIIGEKNKLRGRITCSIFVQRHAPPKVCVSHVQEAVGSGLI